MRKVAREVRLSKWAELIQEQKRSGQSIHGWCSTQGVDKQRYYYWQRKLRESAYDKLALDGSRAIVPTTPQFAEVPKPEEAAGSGAITIHLGDVEIRIAGDASPVAIETVLRVLASR